jgi:putative copper export protein
VLQYGMGLCCVVICGWVVLQYVRIKRIKNMLIKRIKRVVLHVLCWLCCNVLIKRQYADNMRVGLRNMRAKYAGRVVLQYAD